ncbi:uracil-DNA glycosylase [Sphingomonas jeddahensis]|uniref:Uracil DNA glycosylase superfamily protein n=1 Tax=Sphingomonas jeddahensis TaxID=1915074 RepID=A0A1V2EX86_9SPHN|nr:uracil-DNA glycosylase [Sphingomonas jeddahensis]ONF97282.1 Uracil DNA glycosylase superfamily protein [Sphingomonas jeddahensis]
MGADQTIDWHAAAASALEWWRDAGVDVLVGDDPFDWLAAEGPVAVASPLLAASPPAAPVAPTAAMPAAIADFLAWRIAETAPEAEWRVPIVAASGPADADLMILIDCPERDSADSLLGGAAGRLFDRMLAAIGRSRADVHLASVCAARPTVGRMPRDMEARLGEIARHHASLAAPRRLLVMGDAASRAILLANVIEMRGRLHALNHNGGKTTEVVASFHPRMLLERPALKAEAWRDLQLLMARTKGEEE